MSQSTNNLPEGPFACLILSIIDLFALKASQNQNKNQTQVSQSPPIPPFFFPLTETSDISSISEPHSLRHNISRSSNIIFRFALQFSYPTRPSFDARSLREGGTCLDPASHLPKTEAPIQMALGSHEIHILGLGNPQSLVGIFQPHAWLVAGE
jgi:hypothetical protein